MEFTPNHSIPRTDLEATSLEPLWEAWIISESAMWRSWAGKLLQGRGVSWRAFSWQAWESFRDQGGLPDLVLTDGSRESGLVPKEGVRLVEGGEKLSDPWDSWALCDALDAVGVPTGHRGGLAASPVDPSSIRSLMHRYVVAGRRALRDLTENLEAFRSSQSGPVPGQDFLAEAREKSEELEGLVNSLDRSFNPSRDNRGEFPLWPVVEASMDLGCFETPWTWQDGLPVILPDVAASRRQIERVMETVVAAIRSVRTDYGAVVHVSARETGRVPYREVAMEFSGMPVGLESENPELAALLVSLASRMADLGGRFEESAAGIWRCLFPVRPQAVVRRRSDVRPFPRILVVAPDSLESSIYSQVLWKRGCMPVPVLTADRAALVATSVTGRKGFSAAMIADGPGAMPDEHAIRLGLTMPVVVMTNNEERGREWLQIPGVSTVLAPPVPIATAMDALEAAIGEMLPVAADAIEMGM